MNHRISFAVLFVVLAVSLPSIAQNKHVDIALRGPWILYVDSSKSFASYPVLIAMAPAVDNSMYAHQPPIVSNGEAYVIGDLTQKDQSKVSHIYCLTFDNACARRGATSLNPDHYPTTTPLVPVKITSGKTRWDWVSASKRSNAPTLVLPVPDFYSTDTAWPIRFAPRFDKNGGNSDGGQYVVKGIYSTGVQLHYKKGPDWFDLQVCPNSSPNLRAADCNQPAGVSGHTHLRGNGTLHIEMNAPHTDWSCDPHVRYVYPKMLDLIGTPNQTPGPNASYAFIDPAHGTNTDGSGIYDVYEQNYAPHNPPKPGTIVPPLPVQSEYCLEHDSQGGYVDTRWQKPASGHLDDEHPTSDQKDGESPMGECNGPKWIGCVQSLTSLIDQLSLEDVTKLNLDRHNLDDIKREASDLAFPRLSQLRRLDDDIAFLGQETQEERTPEAIHALSSIPTPSLGTLGTFLKNVGELFESTDSYTKTHGDCGAPVMHLTDK
jgi:hypothetical protein